ncbi:MAG: monovalent cation/H(+) antiporter subunit G [Terricaulis sp.]
MSQALALLETARLMLGGAISAVGVAVLLTAVLGLLRFPDFYTRLHAMNAGHIAGAPIVLLGLAVSAPDWGIAARLLVLAALLLAVAPVLAHVLANMAHSAGLAPITGKYVAPRPGARTP